MYMTVTRCSRNSEPRGGGYRDTPQGSDSDHLALDGVIDDAGVLHGGLDQHHRRLVVEVGPAIDHKQRVLAVQGGLTELCALHELLDQVLQLSIRGKPSPSRWRWCRALHCCTCGKN